MTQDDMTEDEQAFDRQAPWPGAYAVFWMALAQLQRNPLPVVIYTLASVLVAALSSLDVFGPEIGLGSTKIRFEYLAIILLLAFNLILPRYALAAADQRHMTVRDMLRTSVKTYLTVLAVGILSVAALVAPALGLLLKPVQQIGPVYLLAWLVLAVWLISRFWSATYTAVSTSVNPIRALAGAYRLSYGEAGKIWGILGVFMLAGLIVGLLASLLDSQIPGELGLVTALTSAFVQVPFIISQAMLYRWLETHEQSGTDDKDARISDAR